MLLKTEINFFQLKNVIKNIIIEISFDFDFSLFFVLFLIFSHFISRNFPSKNVQIQLIFPNQKNKQKNIFEIRIRKKKQRETREKKRNKITEIVEIHCSSHIL